MRRTGTLSASGAKESGFAGVIEIAPQASRQEKNGDKKTGTGHLSFDSIKVKAMNSISLTEEDGSEPLPICRAQRESLVERYKLEAMIALKFFSDDFTESDGATDRKAIDHVRKCPKCRQWFHRVVPKDILHRQSRLARYCCAGMFVAVEEANPRTQNRITFELFRGEDPCWMIDGRRSFISFCPWCGKKLPDHPFLIEP